MHMIGLLLSTAYYIQNIISRDHGCCCIHTFIAAYTHLLPKCAWPLQVPEGVDWAAVVKNAMDTYNLEIAGGLGSTAGKIWRVGLMGMKFALLCLAEFSWALPGFASLVS